MRKSKFTEEQIALAMRQHEAGTTVGEICRKLGIRGTRTESRSADAACRSYHARSGLTVVPSTAPSMRDVGEREIV